MIRGPSGTVQNMVGVTLRHCGDTGPTSPYYSGTIVNQALNAAQRKLNRDTSFNRSDMTIGLHTGVQDYALGTHVLEVYGVTYGSGRRKLTATTRAALNRDSSGWDAATSSQPMSYYCDGMNIGVYPRPNASGSCLNIHHLRTPGDLVNPTSVPTWLPVEFQETICKAAAIDLVGGFNANGDGSAARLKKLYEDYLAEKQQLSGLAIQRSREYRATITPSGYTIFRRRPV